MNSDRARRALGGVSLSSSDESWPAHFRHERGRLERLLGKIAAALQHYGSTAVPGLDAKPITDMMGPVDSLAEADADRDALRDAGYDLIDVGFAKRRFFRRAASGPTPAYHLHLVVYPDWPIKNELLFRDWLIENPEEARSYVALKRKLSVQLADDMPGYTEGKTDFIRRAVNAARASRGLPPEIDWSE